MISRESINGQMQQILDDATDSWGIKVTRIDVLLTDWVIHK